MARKRVRTFIWNHVFVKKTQFFLQKNQTNTWKASIKKSSGRFSLTTGRRRVNILGAINMINLNIVPFVTEKNCNKETIKTFLDEVKKKYSKAQKITIFLDNAR